MSLTRAELLGRHCKPIAPKSPPLDPGQVSQLLGELPGWSIQENELRRTFDFKNYYETIGFVNAIAFIANREDHHPDLEVHYNKCVVRFSTHSVGGLSENDFISAAKVDALVSA